MIALVRYVATDTLRSQRWVAPLLCFAVIDAIIGAQTGSVLPSYAIGAAALLFITTWLTVVVVNNEDPIQQSITEVCAGSQTQVRVAKLLVEPPDRSRSRRPRNDRSHGHHRLADNRQRGHRRDLRSDHHGCDGRHIRRHLQPADHPPPVLVSLARRPTRSGDGVDPPWPAHPSAPGPVQRDRSFRPRPPVVLIGVETLLLAGIVTAWSLRFAQRGSEPRICGRITSTRRTYSHSTSGPGAGRPGTPRTSACRHRRRPGGEENPRDRLVPEPDAATLVGVATAR